MTGTDATTILVLVPVDDVMGALDDPMAAINRQDLLGRRLVGPLAGDSKSDQRIVFLNTIFTGDHCIRTPPLG